MTEGIVDSPRGPADSAPVEPPFFPVSILKFLILALCTFGLYQIYWFYQNWRRIRARERSDISPAFRSIFAIFFVGSLFKRVQNEAGPASTGAQLQGIPLAVGWIITSVLWRLPEPFDLISLAAPLFVVPVQIAAIRANESVAPGHDSNSKFSKANWATIVVGGAWLVLCVIGSFLPDS